MNLLCFTVGHLRLRRRPSMTALAATLGLLAAPRTDAALTLADAGQSRYRIVTATQPIPSERYAAEELQRYLEKLSGARLPIVTDAATPGSHEILLGDNARLRRLQTRIDFAKLRRDGFVLRTQGRRLIIAGDKPRGTLYGVYALLEEKLGVRWFTPEVEVVPRRGKVVLPRLEEIQVPALENRDTFWREMMRDADFAAKHRCNGQHYGLKEKHGGAFTVYQPFVHSFDALVPPELYREHPEYFPLINGRRQSGYVQRCLTHPEVLRLTIERVRQWIREHPEATLISVSQNDTINHCQCQSCKAVDDAEGSPSGSLLKFVNAVAEAVERDHPNVRIDTLAYQYTRKPPRTIRPRPNVIVRLCSIECCFAHPLESCPSEANRRFREDLRAWQPVAPLLYVWDYTPNFAHYQQPFPNFDSLQANVRFFVQHGVKGLFEQGNYSAGGGGELGPLRAYVLAKLLWNPHTDVQRHITEFLHGYYGQAAPHLRAYLDLLQAQVRGKDCHAHIFDRPTACYLTDDLISGAERIFADAERAAENEAVRFRVQVARLPVWYLKIATERVKGDERTVLIRRFLEIARKNGISNISESRSLDEWAKRLGVE